MTTQPDWTSVDWAQFFGGCIRLHQKYPSCAQYSKTGYSPSQFVPVVDVCCITAQYCTVSGSRHVEVLERLPNYSLGGGGILNNNPFLGRGTSCPTPIPHPHPRVGWPLPTPTPLLPRRFPQKPCNCTYMHCYFRQHINLI